MARKQHNLSSESSSKIMFINICRICLESGEIPIFGGEDKPDLSPEISTFGTIKVCQNDDMPQHICNSCYALLQNAILFRDMAKKSEIVIKYQKKLFQEETPSVVEEISINSIWNNKEHGSDHNYAKSETFNVDEQSCSSRNNSEPDLEGTKTPIMKNKHAIKPVTDVTAASEKINETETPFSSCKICNIDFETHNHYYEHILTAAHIYNVKNMGRIECGICRSKMNRSYFVRHLLYHSFGPTLIGGNKYICRICNKIFLSEADVKIHKLSDMHKIAVKTASKIECPVCHITLERVELQKHLSRHASEVANRVKHRCPLCTKVMAFSHYIIHLRKLHNIQLSSSSIITSSTLQHAEKKSKTKSKSLQTSIEVENLCMNAKDSNEKMLDTEENCFEEDTAQISEALSSDEDNNLEKVNIPIDGSINKINNDSNLLDNDDSENMKNNEKQKMNNSVNAMHTCKICNLNFQTSDDYYNHLGTPKHIDTVKKCRKIDCCICAKFINKVYYIGHLKNHSFKPVQTNGGYTCKICNVVLPSVTDVNSHIMSERHKVSQRTVSEIECPICHVIVDMIFLTKHLQAHVKDFKGKGFKRKCTICSKFILLSYYNRHLKQKHNVNKINEVMIDDMAYKNKSKSTEPKTTSYICDVCGKVFHKACVFNAHCLIHREKKYQCDMCPYRTHTKEMLKPHLKAHLGIYKFKCDQCPGLKFLSKSNLNKHIKTHIGPIDFICETCHKGYYTKSKLRNHIEVTHMGLRKFECHICNNTFRYKKGLLTHLRAIHNQTIPVSIRHANYLKAKAMKDNK